MMDDCIQLNVKFIALNCSEVYVEVQDASRCSQFSKYGQFFALIVLSSNWGKDRSPCLMFCLSIIPQTSKGIN